MLYLIDTGVLLRAVDRQCREHAAILKALRELHGRHDRLATSAQCIREFWAVSTRPAAARGGYGRSVEQTLRWVRSFERILQVLPETPATYARWRQIVEQYAVTGVQMHDANLVAVADTYDATSLITLNPGDFARYSTLQVFTPNQIAAAGP